MCSRKMALKEGFTKASSMLLGTCIPSLKLNASKIKVNHLQFDEYLKMYFKKQFVLFAYDPEKICKTGDIVLVQELPKRMSKMITHEVLEVVYPCGDVTDPITGKKVVRSEYRSQLEEEELLYGPLQSAFNYKKAPKRGWQEGKKDFSHRDIYVKYHEFDDGDENKNQPFSAPF